MFHSFEFTIIGLILKSANLYLFINSSPINIARNAISCQVKQMLSRKIIQVITKIYFGKRYTEEICREISFNSCIPNIIYLIVKFKFENFQFILVYLSLKYILLVTLMIFQERNFFSTY